MSTETTVEYQEADLKDVMEYFVNGFDLKGGELAQVTPFEYWLDPVKGKVMFRLFVKREKPDA